MLLVQFIRALCLSAVLLMTSATYKQYQRETATTSPFSMPYSDSGEFLRLGAMISQDQNDIFQFYGNQMLNAWIMFVEWVNEERGGVTINGTKYSISLSFMDDFSSRDYVATGFNHLLNENNSLLEGLDFMLAPYSSSLTRAALEIAIREVLNDHIHLLL